MKRMLWLLLALRLPVTFARSLEFRPLAALCTRAALG
jgi:hypothetical protein